MSDESEGYIKPSALARRLDVTRGAVYKWIREGRLQAVRIGVSVRIPMAEAERFIREQGRAASAGDADSGYNPEHTQSPNHAARIAVA